MRKVVVRIGRNKTVERVRPTVCRREKTKKNTKKTVNKIMPKKILKQDFAEALTEKRSGAVETCRDDQDGRGRDAR